MPDMVLRSFSPQTRHFLDVSPMISALRFQPDDFEYSHGWLRHVPSRHCFQFEPTGQVTIDAICGCAGASIHPEQADQLTAMFQTWRQAYWQPLQRDREFASHFRKPNSLVRLFRDVRMAWRRFQGRAKPIELAVGDLSATPAE